MTLVELSGLISVVGAAIAAAVVHGHTGVLTRIAAVFGGGALGLAAYLITLLLTAGTLAFTGVPEPDQPEGSRLQRFLGVCLLLGILASPIVAILASSKLTIWLLAT